MQAIRRLLMVLTMLSAGGAVYAARTSADMTVVSRLCKADAPNSQLAAQRTIHEPEFNST